MLFTFFILIFVLQMYICAFMIKLAINLFFFVEYLPDDGRKWPKHIGGLPHVCISMHLIIAQFFKYIYIRCTERG